MAILNAIFIFVMLLNVCLLDSQIVQSPCRYFQYRTDVSGYTHGLIKIDLHGLILGVSMISYFTVSDHNSTEYPGWIEYLGLKDSAVTYRVHFPVQQPTPKITQLVANNRLLCHVLGDILRPGVYVSTFGLTHQVTFRSSELSRINGFCGPSKPDNSVNSSKDTPSCKPEYEIKPQTVQPAEVSRRPTPVRPNATEVPADSTEINRPELDLIRARDLLVSPREHVNDKPVTASNPRETPSIPQQRVTEKPLTVQRVPTTPLPRHPAYAMPSTNSTDCGIVSEALPLILRGDGFGPGEWPWLVAIFVRNKEGVLYTCTGSLVSDMHVITAAQCIQVQFLKFPKDYIVRAGVHNLDNWDDENIVTRTLASARIHESYSKRTLANDIAVLTFMNRIEFTPYIRPICLWEGNYDQEKVVGKYGVVAGWGDSEDGPSGRGEPRMIRLKIVSTNTCRNSHAGFEMLTSNNTLCAGIRNGEGGPCNGDAGAGLYLREGGRWKLRGVTSLSLVDNSKADCNLDEYAVFTDVAQYSPWIIDSMISN